MKTLVVILLMMAAQHMQGQQKREIEQRINADQVPPDAVEWLKDAYEKSRKIKWFYEESSGGRSYEAKLKWHGKMHSEEFDTAGHIEDIEITMGWEELPETVQQNITHSLDAAFQKYTIRKIQLQYTGDADDLEDVIDEKEFEDITTHYEIEYYGKNDTHDELWEGLFDARGKLLHQLIFELKPTDNLNF